MTDLVKIEELNLDNELEFEEQPEYLPQGLREGQKVEYDQTWRAHRTVSINKLNKLEWYIPQTKADKDQNGELPKELTAHSSHHVCAVRGIIIEFDYGADLTDNSDPNRPVNICHTTRLIEHLGTNTRDREDRMPLRFPYGQIHKSKKEPHTLNPALDKDHLELYGSRPPVGWEAQNFRFDEDGNKVPESYNGLPRTCKSCVEAGEHYVGTVEQFTDPQAQIPKCGMKGYLIMVVFQLGIYDASRVIDDGGEPEIIWKAIKDCKIKTKDADGNVIPLERPFGLKLTGLTKTQHWKIGTGDFDRNVIHEVHVPEEIYSTGEYFDYLHDHKFIGTRSRVLKGGEICFPVVTELHCGKLGKQQYGSDYIPVFHPVRDRDIISAGIGWTELDWLKTALQVFKLEREVANGKASLDAAPTLPELTAVSSPESKPSSNGTGATKPTTQSKAPAKVFSAFQSKKATPTTTPVVADADYPPY